MRLCFLVLFAGTLYAQAPEAEPEPKQKRMFGILPNYRTTSETVRTATPLSAKGKFKLALDESFDPGAFATGTITSAIAQANNQYPSFGQGMQGYGKRYALMFVDSTANNFVTEAITPILFRQDPRYFRIGHGSALKRVGYALSRIAVIETREGKHQPNGPQLVGTMAAAGLANLYYPRYERTVNNTMFRFASGLGSDSFANLMREFWPDIARKLSRKKRAPKPDASTGTPAPPRP
jgi:hypothetical protein